MSGTGAASNSGRGARKGRGAAGNATGRYEAWRREALDDGWGSLDEPPPRLATTLGLDRSRTVLSYNRSPDVPFDRSINPYRGCEHGCIYCYARPTHAWLGLSPGLDFESRLFYKPDAVACLRTELAARGYRCAPVALGANTDAYQPVERRLRITRGIVELLAACRHPVRIITKSALVERDVDVLAPMAEQRLCGVAVSLTTLDRALARRMEPRAAAPERRLRTIERLAAAGVPVTVLVAPLIPGLTDDELESLLTRARDAGAGTARYVLLRLPLEVATLFEDWLAEHYPRRAKRVMQRVRDCRRGRLYDADFATRMRGEGPIAQLLERRFELARARLGYADEARLDCARFEPPTAASAQLALL